MVRFLCPACGRKYATKAELAGKKIRCNGCGAGVRVPEPGAASHPAMKTFGEGSTAAAVASSTRTPAPVAAEGGDDGLALLDGLAALEESKRSKRVEAVLPSRSVVMEQVRQKAAEQEAATAVKQQEKAKKKRKKKKHSGYFDPKDVLSLVAGVGAFVAVLAFLAWGYPDLRFPVGGFLCLVGFITYLAGAYSIRELVREEGFHHVLLFRFFWPYQLYFVATRWADTKDFVAFFAGGLIILSLGGAVIKTSPIGKIAEKSEQEYQKVKQGNVEPPPVIPGPIEPADES